MIQYQAISPFPSMCKLLPIFLKFTLVFPRFLITNLIFIILDDLRSTYTNNLYIYAIYLFPIYYLLYKIFHIDHINYLYYINYIYYYIK